jgi:lipopolysaccharide O-acetyltransferase
MSKRYSYGNYLRLIISYFYTFLFYKKARLIRIPFDIRNSSNIDLGVNLTTGVNCRLEAYSRDSRKKVLHFGSNVQINDYVHIAAMDEVRVGNNVLIASRVFISDISHGQYSGSFHHSPDSWPVS